VSESAIQKPETAGPRVSPRSGVAPPVEHQFKKGNKLGGRRPVLDPVEKLLREAERERKLAAQWVADLESEDPEIRLPVRKDLMDRINGRAPQSVAVTIETQDPDAEFEGVDPW